MTQSVELRRDGATWAEWERVALRADISLERARLPALYGARWERRSDAFRFTGSDEECEAVTAALAGFRVERYRVCP